MATSPLHPTAVQELIVYKDDSDGTRVVLERTAMPVEEYLRKMFHPDRDYADGCAEERNVGEYEHGRVQGFFERYFGRHEEEWHLRSVPECRLQVLPNRFRVPDILVLKPGAKARPYPTTAPLICIEILSPEDTFLRMQVRLEDYRLMGVENIWVIEPTSRTAYAYTADGYRSVQVLVVEGTEIAIPLREVFSLIEDD